MRTSRAFSSAVRFDFSRSNTTNDKLAVVNRMLSMPQYPYEKFKPLIEALVPKIPESLLKKRLPEQYVDFEDFDIIVSDILGNNDIHELYEHPSLTLTDLLRVLDDLLPPEFIQTVQDSFPLDIPALIGSLSEPLRSSIAAIATLVRTNNRNDTLVPWLSATLCGSFWHGKGSGESSELLLAGVFEKHRKVFRSHDAYWAFITPRGEFSLVRASDLAEITKFHADHIDQSRSGHSLRVWRDSGNIGARLTVALRDQPRESIVTNWMDRTPLFPSSIPFTAEKVPDVFLYEFKRALLEPDTYVLRAMLHHEVIKLKNASEAMKHLLRVFASENQVHRFISTCVANEFTSSPVSETTVLRSNSNLTSLFKVYYSTYGQSFFENVLDPIIDKVQAAGKIGIKSPEDGDSVTVSNLLNTILDSFLTSQRYISPQFRHLASILKSVTATVLRSRRSVFNALSSFICLRFTTATIADPTAYAPEKAQFEKVKDTCIPFAQLLQLPFNLQSISDRYPHLEALNDQIVNRYEEIYNFVVSVADISEPVEYEKPTEEEVDDSLRALLDLVSQQRDVFVHRYQEIYEAEVDNAAASFGMANFIANLFL